MIMSASGKSTLYRVNEDGSKTERLIWEKISGRKEITVDEFAAAVSGVKPLPKIAEPEQENLVKDEMSCYIIADAHIGALAWAAETGSDWDLQIAKKTIVSNFKSLLRRTADTEVASLILLGDFFHSDGIKPLTVASGHLLDTDSRWAKLYMCGFELISWLISSVSIKHNLVNVYIVQGNHDQASSQSAAIAMRSLYANNERVSVKSNSNPFGCFTFGCSLVGLHHGDLRNKSAIPMIFATEFPREWGRTKKRYIFIGHGHHRDVKESAGCVVEQFQAACKADSYSHRCGFRAGSSLASVVISKRFGEVSRNTVSY
jgi:predicted phosphodiesterase